MSIFDIQPSDLVNPPCPKGMDPDWYADYRRLNRLAHLGYQAHDYCWGTGCIWCYCDVMGPCDAHKRGRHNTPNPHMKPSV